jgi:cytochrome c-type biogenesis protein CcmH
MTAFWLVAAAMMVGGVAVLAPALLRRRLANDADRDAQNVAIARERLRELEAERDRGETTDAAFAQAKKELETALAVDLSAPGAPAPVVAAADRTGPWSLVTLLLALPPLALGIYLYLGAPEHLGAFGPSAGQATTAGHGGTDVDMKDLLARLEKRLAEQPDDPQGWAVLARTYIAMDRFPDAASALEKLRALVGDEPEVLVSLADVTAMAQGGSMAGKPVELIKLALAKQPDNPIALWLAGNAAAEAKNWQEALDYWRATLKHAEPGSDSEAELKERIAAAESKLGGAPGPAPASPAPAATPAPAAVAAPSAGAAPAAPAAAAPVAPPPAPGLKVQVTLAPALAERVKSDDVVFVYARAPAGPPMPVAAVRLTAGQLPLTVTLDDSTRVVPGVQLSQFPEVRVEARVAKGGDAAARPGDLRGEAGGVKTGAAEAVMVVIDRVVE